MAVLQALSCRALQVRSGMLPQNISNTLLGLSKLDLGGCGWRPSTQLLEGLAQEAQAKMPDFSAQVCYSLPAEGCCLPDATACQPGGLLLT